jgi:hypothetical protein
LERIRPENFTPEDRARLHTLEQQLQDLRRQQMEVVDLSFRNMYEIGCMVSREKEELLVISGQCRGKAARYEQALKELQAKMGMWWLIKILNLK